MVRYTQSTLTGLFPTSLLSVSAVGPTIKFLIFEFQCWVCLLGIFVHLYSVDIALLSTFTCSIIKTIEERMC